MKYEADSISTQLERVSTSEAQAVDEPVMTGHVLAITAAEHGEGVTTLARRLGQGLCGHLGDTIIIDTNIREGRWRDARSGQGGRRHPGLTEVLVNGVPLENAVQVDMVTQLHLLGAGGGTPKASALLASGVLRRLVQKLRRSYRWVLLDMPPVGLYPDAGAVGRLADGVILTVHAEKTRAEAVAGAQQAILRGGGQLLGSILNRRRAHTPEWLERYL